MCGEKFVLNRVFSPSIVVADLISGPHRQLDEKTQLFVDARSSARVAAAEARALPWLSKVHPPAKHIYLLITDDL
jgi:hypothetical protein